MSAAVYILGGYQSDFARAVSREGKDISDLVREATIGALHWAGIDGAPTPDVVAVRDAWVSNLNAVDWP